MGSAIALAIAKRAEAKMSNDHVDNCVVMVYYGEAFWLGSEWTLCCGALDLWPVIPLFPLWFRGFPDRGNFLGEKINVAFVGCVGN